MLYIYSFISCSSPNGVDSLCDKFVIALSEPWLVMRLRGGSLNGLCFVVGVSLMMVICESRGRRLSSSFADLEFFMLETRMTCGLTCVAALALLKKVDPTEKAGLGGWARPPPYLW